MTDSMEDIPSSASASSASISGAKRKHEEFAAADAADPNQMIDVGHTNQTNACGIEDGTAPKKPRLEIHPMTLAERRQLESILAAQNKSERVCVRSEMEVDQAGRICVHLSIFTPTAASRAQAKEERYHAQRQALVAKKQVQKQKAKGEKAIAKAERDAYEQSLKDQGKTQEEINTLMRERAYALANGKPRKKSNREVQEIKRSLVARMRSQQLQRVVVDCAFDHLMRLEEVCSLAKQIRFMYGANVRAVDKPIHLILTSLGLVPDSGADGQIVDHFDEIRKDTEARRQAAAASDASTSAASAVPAAAVSSSSSLAIPPPSATPTVCHLRSVLSRMDGFERLPMDRTTRHYTECFDHSELVYLTAESPHVLQTLDPSKVYIIGGIVDHNRMKGLCHDLAGKGKIATARLPIPEFLVNDKRTVITVNQVFEILLRFQERQDGDWAAVFKQVLPQRSNWQERKPGQTNADVEKSKAAAAASSMMNTTTKEEEYDEEAENEQHMDDQDEEM